MLWEGYAEEFYRLYRLEVAFHWLLKKNHNLEITAPLFPEDKEALLESVCFHSTAFISLISAK